MMTKVLVVDDVEQNRYLLEALFEGNGFEVVTAHDGKEALEMARLAPPDVCISDILMPGMDGFSLCRNWQKDATLGRVPFVFYTATYTDAKDEAFGLSLGAARYLTKPMELSDLLSAVQEVLAGKKTAPGAAPAGKKPKDKVWLREYNEALLRKLEDKMFQLEKTNRRLEAEIEERRKAGETLRRLHTAIESAAEAILIIDRNGAVEYLNPAFEKITGLTKEEAAGLDRGALVDDREGTGIFRKVREVIQAGGEWEGRLTDQERRGEKVELVCTVSPIREKDGISGYVSILRDVTEQVKLEMQLAQSQKMEAIGTLAGGIAHDFNNILSAIYGYTDLALMDIPEDSRGQKHLGSITQACDRARNLVEQILTFSRKAERARIVTDLRPLIKECIKFLRASIPSTVEIRSHLGTNAAMVMADPVQFHQVILNICTNAAFAMRDDGGVMDIALRELEFDEDALHPNPELKPGEYHLLSISDTGAGMDRETMARIFEPFYTTKEPGEGTGLGLSVAHGIVRDHGGSISVYSEPGRGATFNIYMPATREAMTVLSATSGAPLPTGTEHILLVDDEEALVDVGRQMFEKLGYRVTTARSATEALELFEKDPAGFDLLMTDQTMPRMTGLELASHVFRIRPGMPVIVCTGFSTHISEETARAEGVSALLMKPIALREAANKIRQALEASGT